MNIINSILKMFNGHCNIKRISEIECYIMNDGICYYIRQENNNKLFLHNLNDDSKITI